MNLEQKPEKRLRITEKSINLEGVRKKLYTRRQVLDLYRAIEAIHGRIIDSKPHGIIYLLRGDLVFDRCLRLFNTLERQRLKEQKKKNLWYRLPAPIYVKIGAVTSQSMQRFTEGDLTKGLNSQERHAIIRKVVDNRITPIIREHGPETTLFMIGEAMSGGSMKQGRKMLDAHLNRINRENGLPIPTIKTLLIRKENGTKKIKTEPIKTEKIEMEPIKETSTPKRIKPLSYTPSERDIHVEHTETMLRDGLEIFPVSTLFTIDKQAFHHPLIVGNEPIREPKIGFDATGAQDLMTLLTDFEKIHEYYTRKRKK